MNKRSSIHTEFKKYIHSADHLQHAPQGLKDLFLRMILSKEKDPAPRQAIETYFGPQRLPGTCPIGLRYHSPQLFQDTLNDHIENYGDWLDRVLHQILKRLEQKQQLPGEENNQSQQRKHCVGQIKTLLNLEDSAGVLLRDVIPQQMYEDVFIHMIQLVYGIEEGRELDLYHEFNAICHRLGFALMNRLHQSGQLRTTGTDIKQLIRLAVLSGYVGVNLKSSASAASTLLNRDCIPIPPDWIRDMDHVEAVSSGDIEQFVENMMIVCNSVAGSYGIDAVTDYFSEVVDTNKPTLLAFFSDDYMESIIDLKRFEIMLERNSFLDILFIPRNGRYGNDFSYEDTEALMDSPVFTSLAEFQKKGRFSVNDSGPKAGCVDARFVSRRLIHEMDRLSSSRRLIIETKGCRNFEMLKGQMTVPWYTSFNCNRALSIRTVGIDMQPVFIRVPPGLKAYDGFHKPVIGATPSGTTRGVNFARMTTRDLYNTLAHPTYKALQNSMVDEFLFHQALMEEGEALGCTFKELMDKKHGAGKQAAVNIRRIT